jgi:tripartite-type tricarboxylate transporter receptor subunit TctC
MNMRRMLLALFAVAAIGDVGSTSAQNYRSHPITMVVPFAAGGPTDTIGRILAEHLQGSLGQPVIIENITGAAGSIGVGRVARAAPDGYTLSIGQWGTHVVNGAIYRLPYDLLKDFDPISLISSNAWVIVARKSVPANDLSGLIQWVKDNPGKISAGTAGVGSPAHVFGVLFQNTVGASIQFVPYRGAAPAIQDLMGGQIDIMIDNPTNCLPQVRAGNIKAFAVTARRRLAAAPDIPTVDEAGLPGFYLSHWHGLWVPKGTPQDVVDKLNRALVATLADPAVRRRLAEFGQEVPSPEQQTPQVLAAFQKAEMEKWWPIIKAAHIQPN